MKNTNKAIKIVYLLIAVICLLSITKIIPAKAINSCEDLISDERQAHLLVDELNKYRQSQNLPAVTVDADLNEYSKKVAFKTFIYSSDNSKATSECLKSTSFKVYVQSDSATSPLNVLKEWQTSHNEFNAEGRIIHKGHNDIILTANVTKVGVFYYNNIVVLSLSK